MIKKDCELEEIGLDELVDALSTNIQKDIHSFDEFLNLDSNLKREIYLGDITQGVGQTVDSYIRFWNNYDESHNIAIKDRKPIKIYIDSNGGFLSDCLIICDSIKLSKTPIWTIVVGSAYSSAFDICTFGHRRFAYPHATFLFHEGSISNAGGTVNQFQNYAAFHKKLIAMTKDYLIENTNITEEKYAEMKNEDWWMDAYEALEWGVIDEITEEFI